MLRYFRNNKKQKEKKEKERKKQENKKITNAKKCKNNPFQDFLINREYSKILKKTSKMIKMILRDPAS